MVFDVDVTRNRPDCHGHLGVARDLAAWLDLPLAVPEPTIVAGGPERRALVDIVAGDSCARFTTVVLSGVRVAPSAPWMANRLLAAGQRPINNVVDVSNYVMLELNQPNHAYDLDTLGGGGFRVRYASSGERLTTLDGVDRVLTEADLVICDAHDVPIGLAGIMGGADSEITDATSTVALECAWFEPYGIAATVTRTGLRSDASSRFERGVDPYGIDRGVARFVELLGETCPELVVHAGAVDVRTSVAPGAGATLRRARRPTSTASSAPTSRPATWPGCSTRSATPSTAPAPSWTWRCRRGDRTRPRRSTSSRRSGATTGTPTSSRECRGRRCTAT